MPIFWKIGVNYNDFVFTESNYACYSLIMSKEQHFKTAYKAFERLEQLADQPITYWPRWQESEPLKPIPVYEASIFAEQIDRNLRLAGKTRSDLRPGVPAAKMDAVIEAAARVDLKQLKAAFAALSPDAVTNARQGGRSSDFVARVVRPKILRSRSAIGEPRR